ncbi:unnamed protein product, partial [Porites evermanni]
KCLGNRARGLLAIWREEEIAYVAGFFLKDIRNLKDFSLSGTGVISNVLEIELHHLNSPKDKEVNEIQVQHGEA